MVSMISAVFAALRSSGITLVQVLMVFVNTNRVSEEKTRHL
jgi:hypothetical protein